MAIAEYPDVNSIIRLAREAGQRDAGQIEAPDGREFVLHDSDLTLTLVGDPLEHPRRKGGLNILHSTESFCQWVLDQKTPETVIFADPHTSLFTAVIDYHAKNDGPAGWAIFSGGHALRFSQPFSDWMAINDTRIGQVALAEFLEEHMGEIAEPNGASLLTAVLDLKARTRVAFSKAVSLQTGETQLSYVEETDLNDKKRAGVIALPENLTLVMPVYFGGNPSIIKAKLRVRLRDGDAGFVVKMLNIAEVQREAFNATIEEVQTRCPDVPLYLGSV
jgi:uncharacterized protein YfdQ (DUF2303 family)